MITPRKTFALEGSAFRANDQFAALEAGLVGMTTPDQTHSRLRKCCVTATAWEV